jgi:hypothetical protein
MNRYLIFSILVIIIVGCGHDEPINCNTQSVTLSVLNINESPVYYSRSLTNTKIVNKTSNSLSCSADLNLVSNLDNKLRLQLPVTYIVYKVDKKSEGSTSGLKLTLDNQTKLNAWLKSINALTNSLGDYQLSSGGALYVIKESLVQDLYFNGSPTNPKISNQILSIEKSYTLGDKAVFLIGSYTGGTIDADTLNNYLIQIDKSGNYKATPEFAYIQNGIMQTGESLVINGVIPFRPYAESDDYPIYNYSNGVLNTIRAAKDDSYYLKKFSTLSPAAIINMAKLEQCFDTANNEIDTSHACSYGHKYCFMYRAIKAPVSDANYQILKKACDDNVLNNNPL